ncbi:MAG: hypothetical protein J7L37_00910 [Thermococcus sp.]|nr:hypothetical protein [Thermococcus sp.]
MEEMAIKLLNDGKTKDGLKLMLRAARLYEDEGRKEDAARLFKKLGFIIFRRTGSIEKARPSLLKSAYLYIDLIDDLLSAFDIDISTLDTYCLNVLEIFFALNDERNLVKYGSQFAAIYEDLGKSFKEADDVEGAIDAYESAFVYYKLLDDESYKRVAEVLVMLYGGIAEKNVAEKDFLRAAEAFERLAVYTRALFGYDAHYTEMMETAAQNFEKASKLSYSEGDLDMTTTLLLRAEYAYLLGRNFSRAKLIGVNTARMLNQIVRAYRSQGSEMDAARKLVELAEALIGMGKIREGMQAYRKALDVETRVPFRLRVRLAILKEKAALDKSEALLDRIDLIEFYSRRGREYQALELAEKTLKELEEQLKESLEALWAAEGVY